MTSLMSLWLPILVSAIAVFFVSALAHTALKYHNNDFTTLPDEDAVMAALRPLNIPPGEYVFPHPHAHGRNAMKDPAFVQKREAGPAGILAVMPPGMPGLGKFLFQWFIYSIVVTIFAAYLAGRALGPGAPSAEIVRFVMTASFLGYGLALVHDSIWFYRKWSSTWKNLFDAALYGAVTAAIFVWLWPAA